MHYKVIQRYVIWNRCLYVRNVFSRKRLSHCAIQLSSKPRIAILQSQKPVTPSDAHSLAIQQLAMMRRPINQNLEYGPIADNRCD